jgi:hypothetical protein
MMYSTDDGRMVDPELEAKKSRSLTLSHLGNVPLGPSVTSTLGLLSKTEGRFHHAADWKSIFHPAWVVLMKTMQSPNLMPNDHYQPDLESGSPLETLPKFVRKCPVLSNAAST